jgi:hypothetical protein
MDGDLGHHLAKALLHGGPSPDILCDAAFARFARQG